MIQAGFPLMNSSVSPMRFLLSSIFLIVVFLAAPAVRAQSIIENGNFDHPTEPFKGWVTDYAFTGNKWYVGNKEHLSIVQETGRKNVVQFGSVGDAGVKMECRAFPLEPGFKYVATLDIKGGGYRIYFAGYQWTPGVRPHDNPELGELRMIYQSKATSSSSDAWKQEKIELPGVKLSSAATEALKKVRYLTVYIWMVKPGFLDNVTVTKVADSAMKF